jgi:quinol monooxygenase YgiN
MFVRLVEATLKPGKKHDLLTIITNELIPLMQRQKGFVDDIGMFGDMNPEQAVNLSVWTTKTDVDAFLTLPEYKHIFEMINPLVTAMIVRTYNVEVSTFHKIMAKVA